MKKSIQLFSVAGIFLLFSCGSFPEEIRGSSWYGSLEVMKTGYEGWTEPQILDVTVYLHAFGYAEVTGLPNFTPSLTGNWKQKGTSLQIGGNYAANSYQKDPAYAFLEFNRTGTEMTLLSGDAHRYTSALDKESTSYISEYLFTAVEGKPLVQGLYFRDLEETKWVGDITFEAADSGYSYSKDGGELMARVELMIYPQVQEAKMRMLVTALTPNWKDPEDSSKVLSVGTVLYEPNKFKNWSVSKETVSFTSTLNGEVTFTGVPNNITDYNEFTQIVCQKDDCVFKVDSLTNAADNTGGTQLVIKDDIVFKRDKSYSTSLNKF